MLPHDPESSSRDPSSETTLQTVLSPSGDLLSELLTLVRLRGELIYASDLFTPWELRFEPGAAHFHYIESGRVELTAGGSSISASAGDLLLLPIGAGHRLADDGRGSRRTGDHGVTAVADGASTARTKVQMVSGTFRFDGDTSNMLLSALPPVIRVSRNEDTNAEWMNALVHFLLAEAREPKPGSAIMISRLIDVLVVQTLRVWAAGWSGPSVGWVGAMGDRKIERAMNAIHADPMLPWTLVELADVAAMSRSAFAERFAARVGEPPLRYLKRWRLAMAADLLDTHTLRVGEVARRVGYESDAAFSRAFKEHYGRSPTQPRDEMSSSAA